jgi:hypothetical protein
MHLKANYEASQDRVLLTLRGGPSGDVAFWLTRRHWLSIALACYRARTMVPGETDQVGRLRQKAADKELSAGAGLAPSGSLGIERISETTDDRETDGEAGVIATLVSYVRFQSIPTGIGIRMTTEEGTRFFLPLRGDNVPRFTTLIERLAAKAKWDLPAAISRMGKGRSSQKRFVN